MTHRVSFHWDYFCGKSEESNNCLVTYWSTSHLWWMKSSLTWPSLLLHDELCSSLFVFEDSGWIFKSGSELLMSHLLHVSTYLARWRGSKDTSVTHVYKLPCYDSLRGIIISVTRTSDVQRTVNSRRLTGYLGHWVSCQKVNVACKLDCCTYKFQRSTATGEVPRACTIFVKLTKAFDKSSTVRRRSGDVAV